jgi:hypothetical protein
MPVSICSESLDAATNVAGKQCKATLEGLWRAFYPGKPELSDES